MEKTSFVSANSPSNEDPDNFKSNTDTKIIVNNRVNFQGKNQLACAKNTSGGAAQSM